jgi:hypothetical protein
MIGLDSQISTKDLRRSFGSLADNVQRKVARSAVNFAMTPVLKEARGRIQQRTGYTAANLAKKSKAYKKGSTAVSIVGADRAAMTEINGRPHIPAKIDHLLDRGFIHARSGRFIPGSHYTDRSLEAQRSNVESRMIEKLDRDVAKQIAKARR